MDELELRMAETDRLFAEVQRMERRGNDASTSSATPAPQQKVRYESDAQQDSIYSPAPDFLKPSNQAAADYARMQRDQRLFVDIAVAQSEKTSAKSPDVGVVQRTILDNHAMAAHSPFDPFLGKGIKTDPNPIAHKLPVPGIGPDYVSKDVVVMRDPDSGRGADVKPLSYAKAAETSEIAELKATVAAQQFQINELIKRLS